MSWREKLHYMLLGAASILDLWPSPTRRRERTIEEYKAWVDEITNDPERIEQRKNLKPAFYYNRSTGELRRNDDKEQNQ